MSPDSRPTRHAELGRVPWRGRPPRPGPAARPVSIGGHLRRHIDEHLGALGRDQVADHGGESRGAVVLARQAHGHADGEQQAEVREDRVAGGGDRRHVEQVGLAEPQQQAATGSTAMGSMSARPMGCSFAMICFMP